MRGTGYWQRTITRRRWIRGAVIGGAGLGAAALIGCRGDKEREPASPDQLAEAAPKQGGTIKLPIVGGYGNFSPNHGASQLEANTLQWSGLFTPVERGPNAPLVPVIAGSFEFPDPKTLVVGGLRGSFHNRAPAHGRAITSQDVVATIKQRVADETAHASGYWKTAVDLPSTQTPDEKTVVFRFKEPQSLFSYSIGGSITVQPVEALEIHASGAKHWKDMSLEGVSGSGGWTLARHVDGSVIELVRHDKYALAPAPYIERVRLTVIPDKAAQETAFRSGEVDVFNPDNLVTYNAIIKDLGNKVVGHKRPEQNPLMLYANPARPPFQDKRARKALTRAIDRDKIIKAVYFGEGYKYGPGFTMYFADHHLPWDDPQAKTLLEEYLRYDQQDAKALMDAVIADRLYDGRPLDLLVRSGDSLPEAALPLLKGMIEAVGFRIRVVQLPQAEFNPRVGREGTFDLALKGSHPSLDRLVREYHTNSNILWEHGALNDPETDKMIEAWERAIVANYEDFVKKSRDTQRFLMTTWPGLIPIAGGHDLRVMSSRVKGYDDLMAPSYNRFSVQAQMWLDA